MKYKIISYGKHGKTVEIVMHKPGFSLTLHLKKVGDLWLDKFGNNHDLKKYA